MIRVAMISNVRACVVLLLALLCTQIAGAQQSVYFTGPDTTATRTGPVNFLLTFITGVPNLTAAQVTLVREGTADADVSVFNGDTQEVTVRLTNCTGDGTLAIRVPQSNSQSFPVIIDNTPPELTIGEPSTLLVSEGGTARYRLNYTGAFYVDLRPQDVTLLRTGSANATVSIPDPTSIQPFINLSNITGSGTLAIEVAAGRATDFVGNADLGAPPSIAIAVDSDGPAMVIGPAVPSSDSVQSFAYTILYTGADTVRLTNDFITLSSEGTATANVKVINPTTANPIVTMTDVKGEGKLWITIAGGSSSDAAGNMDDGAGPSEVVEIITGGSPDPTYHSLDQDRDGTIQLGGLLRLIQLYNARTFHCTPDTIDGYAPGPAEAKLVYAPCYPHSSDFHVRDFSIDLRELLRAIQIYYAGGYRWCPDAVIQTEDDYCLD